VAAVEVVFYRGCTQAQIAELLPVLIKPLPNQEALS
jgi:hypothetical protein